MHADDKYHLMMVRDDETKGWAVLGFDSLQKGLDYFTGGYNKHHDRGYEASMSACINYITFKPVIVVADDFEALMDVLVDRNNLRLTRIGNISGSYHVVTCKDIATAKVIYDGGTSPQLITSKT